MGLIPLLIALKSAPSWKSAFWHGYMAGVVFFLGLLYWMILLYPFANIFLTVLGCMALVAYLAVYVGVFSALLRWLPWQEGLPFIFIAPAIWTGFEWVRSFLLTGFPWGSMGYSQWNNVPAIQIASMTGVHGVSFVVVLFNAAIADLIRSYLDWKRQLSEANLTPGPSPKRRGERESGQQRATVFRCANGGITGVIDRYGRITTPPLLPGDARGYRIEEVSLSEKGKTFYTQYGDWFPILSVMVSAVFILYPSRTGPLPKFRCQ